MKFQAIYLDIIYLKTKYVYTRSTFNNLYFLLNRSESHLPSPHPEIPEATQCKVRHALNRMSNGKASGPNDHN